MPVMPTIRKAHDNHCQAIADVYLTAFATALPTVRLAHTADQVREWVRLHLIPRDRTWVATDGLDVLGMLTVEQHWIDQLYVGPDYQGRGIGSTLIDFAKKLSPERLSLWTFQVNEAAQAFYRRHGFVETEWTDGTRNEEQEPDLRMVWLPT